jgi:septal ring-binding cell division protein DamX
MSKKILSFFIVTLFLSACTTFDVTSGTASGKEYLGWYCEGDVHSDDQWKCTERLMINGEPVVEEEKPQPESDNTLVDTPKDNPKTQTSEKDSVEHPAEKTFDISAEGYTVQLGAYLDQAMAERSADKINITQGQLRVRDIIAEDQYRFVIVYGQYQTRAQAQASAERLVDLNPQLEYWIRTIKSMRDGF